METYMQFVPYKQQQGEQQYALLQKFNSLLNQIQFHTQAESMYNRK